MSDLIGTSDAASVLGVSLRTAKRLAESGKLPHAVKLPGRNGPYLFHRADVEALATELAEATS